MPDKSRRTLPGVLPRPNSLRFSVESRIYLANYDAYENYMRSKRAPCPTPGWSDTPLTVARDAYEAGPAQPCGGYPEPRLADHRYEDARQCQPYKEGRGEHSYRPVSSSGSGRRSKPISTPYHSPIRGRSRSRSNNSSVRSKSASPNNGRHRENPSSPLRQRRTLPPCDRGKDPSPRARRYSGSRSRSPLRGANTHLVKTLHVGRACDNLDGLAMLLK